MARRGDDGGRDLTVLAVPFYFATMAAEYRWLRRRAATRGPSAGDYERRDTLASLAMGVGSLLAPLVGPRLLRPVTPGRGRYAKTLVLTTLGAVAVTTVADRVARRDRPGGAPAGARPSPDPVAAGHAPSHGSPSSPAVHGPSTNGAVSNGAVPNGAVPSGASSAGESSPGAFSRGARSAGPVPVPAASRRERRGAARLAGRVASVGGVVSVVGAGVAVTTTWASRTTPQRMWRHRFLPDLGTGPWALLAAVAAWDFVYYWDHRFMHSSRYMWAIHVVHHSSEHYNLSTALRQPVAEALGTFLPFGALCLFGIRPGLVETARGVNLLYQYWIHTETIGRLGPPEAVLNTPSHHRVHHGSNQQYLDRNHGSILIVWDRLFGTFEPEAEPVVYGLTKNIDTFNPARIATHEYRDILRDVAASTSWGERLSYVVRGPGWATRHRAEVAAVEASPAAAPQPVAATASA